MIEKQFKTLKEPFIYYAESQVVQLILPCFVASFLDMDKDSSVSQESKEMYLSFIHELIKSYEEFEFTQKLVSVKRKTDFFNLSNAAILVEKIEHFKMNVSACLTKNIGQNVALDVFLKKGLGYLSNIRYKTYNSKEQAEPWPLQLCMLLCRMNSCLEKLAWLEDSQFQRNSLIALLQSNIEQFNLPFMQILQLVSNELKKNKFFHNNNLTNMKNSQISTSNVLINASKELSLSQIHSIAQCEYFSTMADSLCILDHLRTSVQDSYFAPDYIDVVLWSYVSNDRWKLMQQLCKLSESSPLVSLQFAKKNICYESLLKTRITPEGKVKMSKPGEITFFPVKHCRWCGTVNLDKFRVCPECTENPDYRDFNFFCSEKCETECLEKQHIEEHVRFLMIRCGISE